MADGRRRGRPGITDWAAVAQFVRRWMVDNQAPKLESAMEAIPDELLIRNDMQLFRPLPETVQRWISILQQIESFALEAGPRRADVEALRNVPVAAAELICRWSSYDRTGALAAAQKMVAGRLTLGDVRTEESIARHDRSRVVFGRQRATKVRFQVGHWASSLLGPDFVMVDMKSKPPVDRLPGDLVFRHRQDPSRAVIALTHGPFTDPMEYDRRLADFLAQLIGAGRLAEKVIGIAPDGPPYWSFFDKHGVTSDNIEIHVIDYEAPGFSPAELLRRAPPDSSAGLPRVRRLG